MLRGAAVVRCALMGWGSSGFLVFELSGGIGGAELDGGVF